VKRDQVETPSDGMESFNEEDYSMEKEITKDFEANDNDATQYQKVID
jgi:hypothetical protein